MGEQDKTNNEKIFHWLRPDAHWHTWVNMASILCHICDCGAVFKDGWNPNPQYDADPTATLNLLDELVQRGYCLEIHGDRISGGVDWEVSIAHVDRLDDDEDIGARWHTLPVAVANAVLDLIEAESETTDAGSSINSTGDHHKERQAI